MKLNIGSNFMIIISMTGWLLAVFLLTRSSLYSNVDTSDQIAKQLEKAMIQLELLKTKIQEFSTLPVDSTQLEVDGKPCTNKTYLELQKQLESTNNTLKSVNDFLIKEKLDQPLNSTNINENYEGVHEVERLHRRIHMGVKEMWYYTSSELNKLRSLSKEEVVRKRINQILEEGVEHKRALFVELYNLSVANGRMDWVRKEIKELEEIVERRLTALQNPSDCDIAKKIVCNLNLNDCGFGCQLHHTVHCLIVAYGTQRTMILKSKGWHYSPEGWESVFQPVSNTCVSDSGITKGDWTWPLNDTIQVVTLPRYYRMIPKPPFLPLAIPEDLSERLMTVHGDPSAWWIAQFVKYLMRPQEPLAQYLRNLTSKMDFQKPIVGVQVRRTDKVGTEAAFHSIEEYMEHVEEYYETLALRQEVPVRRVYLASDDPSIYADAKHKFPDYLFLGDPEVAKSASTSKRYSLESLKGIVGDIHLLAHTDYLVCTFTSNVGRLVYEIMQTLNPDPSAHFRSLDSIYFFFGQLPHTQTVLYNHTAGANSSQFDMRVGDVVELEWSNNYDGYCQGLNRMSNQSGLFPCFKAEDSIPLF